MKHCAGQIKYLVAIKELSELDDYVKCVSIARRLGVSRASVSKMLRCLANSGLVYEDFCNSVVAGSRPSPALYHRLPAGHLPAPQAYRQAHYQEKG